jgi:Fic-DOC domain mobile mystery protein B
MNDVLQPDTGETPIDDVSGLKIKGISTRAELNRAEGANIQKAVNKYLAKRPTRRSAPFDFTWFRRLHKQMFGDVWRWAGELRKSATNIGVPWELVESSLYDLYRSLPYWQEMPLIEQACLLHHKAVHIHPFKNGNGRWARLLANIWLKQNRHAITSWPETSVGQTSTIRDEYLIAIRKADNGDLEGLLELHRRFTDQ